MDVIFYLVVLILSLMGAQFVVGKLVSFLFKKIIDSINSIEKGTKNKKWYKDSDFQKESANLFFIEDKKKHVGFITKIIGYIELVAFAGLMFLLFRLYNYNIQEVLIVSVKFIGGWLAIKTIGNYQQWSGGIFGRAYFYIFFIGSIMNIMLGIIIGYVFNLLI